MPTLATTHSWPLPQPPTACPVNWVHEKKFRTLVHALLAVDSWVPPGAIIDAGANLGEDSCFFAEQAPDRTIYAIEPLEVNARHIRSSFSRLTNLVVTHGGLGDCSERVELKSLLSLGAQMQQVRGKRWQEGAPDQNLVASATGGSTHRGARTTASGFKVFQIDELFSSMWPGARLGLVHLDVEGMEAAALRGGLRTLLRDRPILTTEFFPHTSPSSFVTELFSILDYLGYDSYLVDEQCGRPADCRNLINLPRTRHFPMSNQSTAFHRALSSGHVRRINLTSSRLVLPCCEAGGACCRHGHSCCRSDVVRHWLLRHPPDAGTGATQPARPRHPRGSPSLVGLPRTSS